MALPPTAGGMERKLDELLRIQREMQRGQQAANTRLDSVDAALSRHTRILEGLSGNTRTILEILRSITRGGRP